MPNDKSNGETFWWIDPNEYKVSVSTSQKYTFGFTGLGEWVDDLDPFEVYVRETLEAAGVELPPPPKKWVSKPITFGGTFIVPNPKLHKQFTSIELVDENTNNGNTRPADSELYSEDE